MSGGVALFDYDNDGCLDIYFVNSLTVDLVKSKGKTRSALYRNRGDGTFADVTDKAGVGDIGWGMGVAVGDYDNDGFDDLYVTCVGAEPSPEEQRRRHVHRRDRRRRASATRAGRPGASFVDYDNDGRLDLFVANYVAFDFNNLPEFGKDKTCQFKGVAVQCGPRGLPGDGRLALPQQRRRHVHRRVEEGRRRRPERLLRHGRHLRATSTRTASRTSSSPTTRRRTSSTDNNGDGTFKEIGFVVRHGAQRERRRAGVHGRDRGDYDHDGRLDLFVTNFDDEYNTLYHNDGAQLLRRRLVRGEGRRGEPPLRRLGDEVLRLRQRRLGRSVRRQRPRLPADQELPPAQLRPPQQPRRDVRGGRRAARARRSPRSARRAAPPSATSTTTATSTSSSTISTARRNCCATTAATRTTPCSIKTVGVKSNRGGVGARVSVVSGDLVQKDEVRSGDSYISQSDLRLHFGLERRTKIDLIEVRWPSGAVDKVTDAKVNSLITIKEGQGVVAQKEFKARTADVDSTFIKLKPCRPSSEIRRPPAGASPRAPLRPARTRGGGGAGDGSRRGVGARGDAHRRRTVGRGGSGI